MRMSSIINSPALKVLDNPIPKLMLKGSARVTKSPSIEHQHQYKHDSSGLA